MPSLVASPVVTVPSASGGDSLWSDLFHIEIPWDEKILRTVLVYLVILVILRVFGKRTLAQWNSFDLVVVLLLSNVVQNAIIGPDNSFAGGAVGALVLVGFNWVVDRVSFLGKNTERMLEGTPTTLIRDGVVDEVAMTKMGLRHHELLTALHQQGADTPKEVRLAALQPGGTFNVSLRRDDQSASYGEMQATIAGLQAHLDARLTELESRLGGGPAAAGGRDQPA